MDGPLSLQGPLRPVPVYYRRPLDADLLSGGLLSSPRIQPSAGSSQKVKDSASLPSHLSFPSPSLISSSIIQPPPRTEQTGLSLKEELHPSSLFAAKTYHHGEWSSPLSKSGVPLITPVRGPDLRSVALYQSLLRHHPAYHHLLETFLLPPLPPLLCAPSTSAICDTPFTAGRAYYSSGGPHTPHHPLPLSVPTGLTMEQQEDEEVVEKDEERLQRRRREQSKQATAEEKPIKDLTKESPKNWPPNKTLSDERNLGKARENAVTPHTGSASSAADKSHREECDDCHGFQTARDGKVLAAGRSLISTEELVSSITAIPDPYQQYGYGRKLFPCPQCRYTTDRRNNLKRHMLTMHQLSAKLLECCGLLFRTKAALREHALVFHYHGYTCFYCARRFCRKALLKRHLSVHNGQKEFLCNVCDYATSHKSNLERHRRVHGRQEDDVFCEDRAHSEELMETVSGHLSEDDISVCSRDEDSEEIINVHSD